MVLSPDSDTEPEPNPAKKCHYMVPDVQMGALMAMMKDIGTMDVALTFGLNGSARNVALWAHRSVLAQQPGLHKLFDKLKAVESSSTDTTAAVGVLSCHVNEYSLEGYCSLISFLYTGTVDLQVDLNHFAIGSPPNRPFSSSCKERPDLDMLFPSTAMCATDSTSSTSLVRSTTWGELFQLADCYAVQNLREYCWTQIVESMTMSNSLEILLEVAYRFDDLKSVVLAFVAQNLDKMYAGGEDPFEKFNSHPERHTLLADALRIKLKAPAGNPAHKG